MPFADRADEELVGIVVVIPVRAVGIEEEEPWVFPDERVEVDVRTVLARRGEVDSVGDHFLAGPGLAEKEHRFGRYSSGGFRRGSAYRHLLSKRSMP